MGFTAGCWDSYGTGLHQHPKLQVKSHIYSL
jgi:hypothetical protein